MEATQFEEGFHPLIHYMALQMHLRAWIAGLRLHMFVDLINLTIKLTPCWECHDKLHLPPNLFFLQLMAMSCEPI